MSGTPNVPRRGTPVYPPGTVRALLDTELVTPPTRAALRRRLAECADAEGRDAAPRFLDPLAFATLRAACARLVAQADRTQAVAVAADLDARLARGDGNGWRYATMPSDPVAYRLGLRGLDESARARFGVAFAALDGARQDAVLRAVQRGRVTRGVWDDLPPRTFFAELLADATECYYSYPSAQEEIGYAGMADASGWRRIGLNERDLHEPRAAATADA